MKYIIDFCHEEDGFINLDSPDLGWDDLQQLRNTIEIYILREGVPRNHWGEITIDLETDVVDDDICIDYRPCTDDE